MRRVVIFAAAIVLSSTPGLLASHPVLAGSTSAGVTDSSGGTVSVGVSNSSGSSSASSSSSSSSPSTGCQWADVPSAFIPVLDITTPPTGPGHWDTVTCPNTADLPAPGPLVVWYTTSAGTAAFVWIPDSAPAPSVSARQVAADAASEIALPHPAIILNPVPAVVNLSEWLAINPSVWHAFTATASVSGVSAAATATPVSVTWSMGDGTTVVCGSAGNVYNPAVAASAQSPTCSHTYLVSSYWQPSSDGNPDDVAYTVSATITWSISWSASGASGGGSLPPIMTSSTTYLRVIQIESVVTP